ncbi:YidC/Oxa1 family membrane protein insertase [Faecalicatena contorta]|uniref:YidC/Oxa1 family membrane protein insertase n=1 Tax=Faecalicatena fissicatena TaxID=290055 RepID=A0ABS2EA41_9FIRM|nr:MULTISPECIES: YidC/Oxa1 family membrane protein insertase [Clostridia]MBM6686207.1 YidC/Oxa1 family membrane protein insertase [Faecalicatena contorta]MBM6711573.1 YidC/Oxa1 family membrane protein insertase [Faecalicatena contorta]MBM6738509.1 YidC/Oxa1 family membrane protein insertase [Faecalicatena fissicatena]HIX98298.1 YidC/Oxa1 family membrane protein insertase [Candidatus Dorea intestinigallinarum]
MEGVVLTAANWPIIGQIADLLGIVMNFIYEILDKILPSDVGLVGLSIILYTILVYMIMMPLTIKQQRTSKMTTVMNPELQAIQKKYKNKRDQASQMKMQEEMQQVYDKYGTSMTGGCLPMLLQMVLLFSLYPVVYQMEKYVPAIKDAPADVQKFLTIPDLSLSPMQMFADRAQISEQFGVSAVVLVITAIALPAISVLTQFLSMKLSQALSGQAMDKDNPMYSTMRTMNITMPLFSLFVVVSLPAGLGLYWIISAVVRCLQQIFINKHLKKISVDELIEKNKEKAAKKREKRGERAEKINAMAQTNTRSIQSKAKTSVQTDKAKEEKLQKAANNKNTAKEGSLASKANLVKKYNENN